MFYAKLKSHLCHRSLQYYVLIGLHSYQEHFSDFLMLRVDLDCCFLCASSFWLRNIVLADFVVLIFYGKLFDAVPTFWRKTWSMVDLSNNVRAYEHTR